MKAIPIRECCDCLFQGDSWGVPDDCNKFVTDKNGIALPGPGCPFPDIPEISNPKTGPNREQLDFVKKLRREATRMLGKVDKIAG